MIGLLATLDPEADALAQIGRYLDRAGLGEGWLVVFDLRKEVSWADKLFVREVEPEGKTIRIAAADGRQLDFAKVEQDAYRGARTAQNCRLYRGSYEGNIFV